MVDSCQIRSNAVETWLEHGDVVPFGAHFEIIQRLKLIHYRQVELWSQYDRWPHNQAFKLQWHPRSGWNWTSVLCLCGKVLVVGEAEGMPLWEETRGFSQSKESQIQTAPKWTHPFPKLSHQWHHWQCLCNNIFKNWQKMLHSSYQEEKWEKHETTLQTARLVKNESNLPAFILIHKLFCLISFPVPLSKKSERAAVLAPNSQPRLRTGMYTAHPLQKYRKK